ncbi:hypothetical protein [Pontibacter chinhatensis]|uniref:Uncharacterized protein n=1 Tax=Pontibacter chinhatensis TaxID=1436961 RepID=A0A1I2WUL1_9BACT|nr:hypothetical protein [Pontibacter chinhatensis]SFH04942.1 hypothetical protein SAMN05421739_105206 [Pontibacter chinhatensis]
MRIVAAPTYRHIFDEPAPQLTELLKDIPTKVIIGVVSVINAELYLKAEEPETHKKILDFLLFRQNQKTKRLIIERIYANAVNSEGAGIAIFSTHLLLEFLHHSLLHYYENEQFIDTNPTQELSIFKAYFLIAEKVNARTKLTKETNSHLDYYRRNTWPTHINQIEINDRINYLNSMVRSKCFFDFLEYDSKFSNYVSSFLQQHQFKDSWSYIFTLVQTIQISHQTEEESRFAPFYINIDISNYTFLDELCLDPKSYSEQFIEGKRNYDGFKDKPLIKFGAKSYLVIDWNLLANKLYNGLIYDFFSRSGIAQEPSFKNTKSPFIAFKKFISEYSIENYLFKRLISSIFKGTYSTPYFSDQAGQGLPDAYIRVGKRIFIFEIKDAFFPTQAVESYNYDQIVSKIDEKYNTDKKGTGQLIKHFLRLREKPFEPSSYSKLKLKTRNLVIYPIIIYTDTFFSLPGVMLYLQQRLRERITQEGMDKDFQQIKSLSFFNIDFLIENLDLLQKKENSLDRIIDYVLREITKREKRYERKRKIRDLLDWKDNFEIIASKMLDLKVSRDYVRTIFNELDLNQKGVD